MNCHQCNQEASRRESLDLDFCLDCNIWLSSDCPEPLTPQDFCAIIPEVPRPLSEKEKLYALEVAMRLDDQALEVLVNTVEKYTKTSV